jgi:hypothetical protein
LYWEIKDINKGGFMVKKGSERSLITTKKPVLGKGK